MPDNEPNNTTTLNMPPAEELAVQAIAELIAEHYPSSVMKLSRPVLNELARRLVQPGETVNDAAVEWLEQGGHDVKRSSVYRFAQRFREVYKRVWAGWANRMIVAKLSADPEFDVARLQDLIKNRVTTLVAQEVMTSDPSELKTDRLFAHLSLIAAADKGRLERDKLELARDQAESRAAKLEAEIEKIRGDQARKDRQIEERIKALRATIDDLSKRASRGEQITEAQIRHADADLIELQGVAS
jgi:hypothetical protein